MTTTGEFTTTPPAGNQPPAGDRPHRVLRRSRTDRVGAGVAGGLGAYFGVDPVLFRVLFATAAFFGGAGVLAYLLAWAAIPEEGTTHAAIDRWMVELRRRRVPLWAVLIVGGLIIWGLALSWWLPGPFVPLLIIVIVLVAIFARRAPDTPPPPPYPYQYPYPPAAPTTAPFTAPFAETPPTTPIAEATAAAPEATATTLPPMDVTAHATPAIPPTWTTTSRQWLDESRAASRERRRRAFPVRITAVIALVLTLTILGIVDAASGIAFPVYFWVTGGIALAALLVGAALRRTPWSLATLLVPATIGLMAFGGTSASLHDGTGQHEWTPTTTINSQYRLAFGEGILDLTRLAPLTAPRTVDVTMAAGHVRVIVPRDANVVVHTNVRIGAIEVDGTELATTNGPRFRHDGGLNIDRTIFPPSNTVGYPLTINVHLADGLVSVDHA